MKPRTLLYLGAGLVVLIILAVQGYKWSARKDERVRDAVEETRAALDRERETRAALELTLADSARQQRVADSLAEKSRRDSRAAAIAEAKAKEANARFEALAALSPPECLPLIVEARATIKEQGLTIASLTSSRDAEKQRADGLQITVNDLRSKAAAHVGASARVDTAATKLAATVRPAFFKRMVNAIADFGRPKFGVSVVGGVDLQGKLNAVAGVSIGWTF